MTYQKWTDAEVAKIRALVAAGWRRKDIVAEFSYRDPAAVTGKLHRMGIRTSKPRDSLPWLHRYRLATCGLTIGSANRDLSPEVQKRAFDYAARHGTTIIGALDAMLIQAIEAQTV